jgi:lysophospholipase
VAAVVGNGIAAVNRALPDSPTGGYAPGNVDCPPNNRPTIREASSLSPNETSWLEVRRNKTVDPMITFLSRANISGFDARSYISNVANNATALPNIAIAASGGGYRALMNGAGFIAAADDRTPNSTNTGHIGGLLQATTYLAGLSGGGWLVGSIYSNNFSSVVQLRDGSDTSAVWQFGRSIFQGPEASGLSIFNTADYWSNLVSAVSGKGDAGYPTSITDYWGRALSYQLINATDGGPSYTFSSIALQQSFTDGDWPMPLLVSDARAPGTKIISLNSTVYEFNPFELGSWDPTTFAFAPLRYVGTNFVGGVVPDGEQCVRGFDNAGFVMGTSSTLFNQFFLQVNSTDLPSFVISILRDILGEIGRDNDDIAEWTPNPFFGYNNDTSLIYNTTSLTLVDGGEDLQNIPLNPLIQPIRGVDVIFAVDSSADTTYNWPNGTAIVATYERSMSAMQNGTAFPSIPDQNTFVNLGLNTRPTFFGCDANNITGEAPLIVYIPNSPYVEYSNVSTFDLSYNPTQRNMIIQNGYDVATLGNGTVDAKWPTCVACAVLSRSFHKTGTTVPQDCVDCFQRYCWDGTRNSTAPGGDYMPTLRSLAAATTNSSGSGSDSGAASFRPWFSAGWLVTAALGLLLV